MFSTSFADKLLWPFIIEGMLLFRQMIPDFFIEKIHWRSENPLRLIFKERSSFYTSLFPHARTHATLALKPNISAPVAFRDLIFCTHLVFIVDRHVRKFYQNRPNGYRNRAKNIRRLSRVENVAVSIFHLKTRLTCQIIS